MTSEDFRKCIVTRKKIDHFPDIFHMPTKSKRIRLRFFIFEKSEPHTLGFGRHMENVGKMINFFSCHHALPKVFRNHFLMFLGAMSFKPSRKSHEIFLGIRQLIAVLNFASLFQKKLGKVIFKTLRTSLQKIFVKHLESFKKLLPFTNGTIMIGTL